ncbi:MAG: hypothetical protein Q8P18_18445 [Pseudomonadota bacterium]|nr:hypothetical protein [Pseudomonadota bacterium]
MSDNPLRCPKGHLIDGSNLMHDLEDDPVKFVLLAIQGDGHACDNDWLASLSVAGAWCRECKADVPLTQAMLERALLEEIGVLKPEIPS